MPYEIAVNRRRSRRTERECLPHAEATPLNRKVDLALIPLSTVASVSAGNIRHSGSIFAQLVPILT
jgi:hypothetical protein